MLGFDSLNPKFGQYCCSRQRHLPHNLPAVWISSACKRITHQQSTGSHRANTRSYALQWLLGQGWRTLQKAFFDKIWFCYTKNQSLSSCGVCQECFIFQCCEEGLTLSSSFCSWDVNCCRFHYQQIQTLSFAFLGENTAVPLRAPRFAVDIFCDTFWKHLPLLPFILFKLCSIDFFAVIVFLVLNKFWICLLFLLRCHCSCGGALPPFGQCTICYI